MSKNELHDLQPIAMNAVNQYFFLTLIDGKIVTLMLHIYCGNPYLRGREMIYPPNLTFTVDKKLKFYTVVLVHILYNFNLYHLPIQY